MSGTDGIYVIGHRGAMGAEPENTMRSFRLAVESGADEIELDIRLTRDGRLVVMHDETVDRTTDGVGEVAALTLDEIRSLDAGCGERVPTYEEVLAAVDLPIHTEIKGVDAVGAFAAVVDELRPSQPLTVASAKREILAEAVRQVPDIPRTIFLPQSPPDSADLAAAVGATWAFLKYPALTGTVVERCRAAGFRVGTWAISEAGALRHVLDCGVEAVMTDYPHLIATWASGVSA